MSSGLFERPAQRVSRPRKPQGEVAERFGLTMAASTKFQLSQAAVAENVSLSYLFLEGAQRLARQAYEEREQGLVPVPARLGLEQLDLIQAAARERGMSVDQWVVHALMDAAACAENERVAA